MALGGGDPDGDPRGNQPYDEAVAVEDDEESEVDTPGSSQTGSQANSPQAAQATRPQQLEQDRSPLAAVETKQPKRREVPAAEPQQARSAANPVNPNAERAYDEAVAVETDDSEVDTPESSEAGSPAAAKGGMGQRPPGGKRQQGGGDETSDSEEEGDSGSEGSSTSDSEVDGHKKGKSAVPSGAYNPDNYKHLKVSSEIEEAFQFITRYKPHSIELDTALKPFVPEFVPSIGEVDAFLKMPRPDGQPCDLGNVQLDEPALNPSDPSILDLKLVSLSKNQDVQPMEIRSIENAEKNPKEIENWVKRIEELNRGKPAATVMYTKRMPDIEQLMQVWMAEFEEYLQQNPLPDMADLDLDLKDYIRVIASILDVPVYGQMTETLHVIFTLYSEFKTNQHFSKTETLGGNAEQYNFSQVGGHFMQGPHGKPSQPGSRAPSPLRQN